MKAGKGILKHRPNVEHYTTRFACLTGLWLP